MRGIFGKIDFTKMDFLVVTLLFISVFGWYYMATEIIEQKLLIDLASEEIQVIWLTFNFSVIGSSIFGAILSKKLNKNQFLYGWTILGIMVSLSPMILNKFSFFQVFSISFLLGVSFGLGMPSFLQYFADSTNVENRGRIGAISFLIANVSVPFLFMVVEKFDLLLVSLVFSFVRAIGLILFFSKQQKNIGESKSKDSFFSILSDKSFLLYFVVWLVFPLVDRFESTIIVPSLEEGLLETMSMVEPLVGAVTILVAGILCDLIGRKKVMLSGFVSLGFAYAIIAFFFDMADPSIIWYFYFIIDAIAWGIFMLTYILVIWGDLSEHGSRVKYYALGGIPFFLSNIIPKILPSVDSIIELNESFSLAALFLFVALLPLVFAPETLPEKKMELRRLKSFAEQAKKEREKFESKNK